MKRNFLVFRQKVSIPIRRFSEKPITSVLKFDDHKQIYRYKTNWELIRSLLILRTCSVNFFVENALSFMKTGQKIFGSRLFPLILRPTFYKQFVGGDSEPELLLTAQLLHKSNLKLMVCPVQEEDIGEIGKNEAKYDSNLDYIQNTALIMARSCCDSPNLQLKVTALMSADLVAKLSNLLLKKLVRLEDMVCAIAESDFHTLEGLTDEDKTTLHQGIGRISSLIQVCKQHGLKVLFDGEYTYLNPAISAVALSMMLKFNTEQSVVANTYQCYLKNALDKIKNEKFIVDLGGCHFGAKVVRGAYLEKERLLAKLGGYPDPINDTYEKTGEMYNKVIDFLLEESLHSKDIYVVVATHNEKGANHALKGLHQRGIDTSRSNFVFAQIYGMGEQLSMPLATAGFTVYKSVPYGPIDEVLPYLSRRATENRAVMSGARKEKELLTAELKRRLASTLLPNKSN